MLPYSAIPRPENPQTRRPAQFAIIREYALPCGALLAKSASANGCFAPFGPASGQPRNHRPKQALGRRQAVRHRFLVPAFPGSNPGAPANLVKFIDFNSLNGETESLPEQFAGAANRPTYLRNIVLRSWWSRFETGQFRGSSRRVTCNPVGDLPTVLISLLCVAGLRGIVGLFLGTSAISNSLTHDIARLCGALFGPLCRMGSSAGLVGLVRAFVAHR